MTKSYHQTLGMIWKILLALFFFQQPAHSVLFDEVVTERAGMVRRDESSSATVNALATTRTFVKLTSTVTTVNGAVAPTSPNARTLLIFNATGSVVTINHESGSATAANRFTLPGAEAIELADDAGISFIYDHGTSRWVKASGAGGGIEIDGVNPGDLIVWDGSEFVILPKGPNNFLPAYDSGQPLGITSYEATDQHSASTIVKRDSGGDFEARNILDENGATSAAIQSRTLRNSSGTGLVAWSGTYAAFPGVSLSGSVSGRLDILAHASMGSTKTLTLPNIPCSANEFWSDNGSGVYSCATINNILPSQTGNSGEFLTTNGSASSWAEIGFGDLPQITSYEVYGRNAGTTGDAASTSITSLLDGAFSSVQGSILYRGASAWLALAPGTNGHFLKTQGAGANPQWAAASGSSYSGTCNVLLNGGAGAGSTATNVREFVNLVQDCADASATVATNSTNGTTITINTAGYYCAAYKDRGTGEAAITLNASVLTSIPSAMTQSEVLDGFEASAGDAKVVWCGRLASTDVIRYQFSGFTSTTAFDVRASFSRMQ